MLNDYTNQVKSLLHDFNLSFFGSPFDMTGAINQARMRVAADAQCVRFLLSGSPISNYTITNAGTGYTSAPTLTIADAQGSGFGADYTPQVSGGHLVSLSVVDNGQNYAVPVGNLTGGGGTGATVTFTPQASSVTVPGQEVYKFTDLSELIPFQDTSNSVGSILAIFNVAVSQGGTVKPMLRQWPWGQFQARLRSYSPSVTNYPTEYAQYSQGVNGSLYLYPIPSGVYLMEIDCICLPVVLFTDGDPEAIPYPWTSCVPYYAAYLALLYAQRREDAMAMKEDYRMKMTENGAFARPVVVPYTYGRRW